MVWVKWVQSRARRWSTWVGKPTEWTRQWKWWDFFNTLCRITSAPTWCKWGYTRCALWSSIRKGPRVWGAGTMCWTSSGSAGYAASEYYLTKFLIHMYNFCTYYVRSPLNYSCYMFRLRLLTRLITKIMWQMILTTLNYFAYYTGHPPTPFNF